ncbi:hypothetical protein CHR55_26590 [Rhodococcus qingshengii]|uniref:Uncharacterized protein n=1 Tax=Rhodococcus qingshengii TaxID=334542 RepID=A0A2A5J3T3_RHOSG|nr:hypothetical protein [Rhodococcus erythropolis]MBO8150432.1 hypothetical protein [Rhodococcus erythropolis]MDO1492714.1 hypothetical protein [Rhodococcus erythropolis]PCK24255.1 hypothetical protein CHR55_26590 [Rhodococcus qingshengii]GCB59471.1 hypothetical protein rerp_58790 [Rhodococcus erythropolis]
MSVKREPAIRKTHPAELIPERPPRGDATPAAPAATPSSPSADFSARKDEEEKLSMTHNTRIKPSTKDRLRRGVDKLRYETGDREISEASMTEAALDEYLKARGL